MKGLRATVVGLFACLVLLAAGCGGDDPESPSNAAAQPASTSDPSAVEGTLTFLACCDAAFMETLITQFEDRYPNVTVKQEVVPFENLNDVVQSRLAQQDTSFDIYDADQPRTAALASRGFLLDITDAYGGDAAEALFPESLEASTWDDKVWSAPLWSSSQVLYYNTDLLKKAGVEPPSKDPAERWTWEQLVEAATKAKEAGASCGFMFDQPDRYYQLQPLMESAGGGSGLTGDDMTTPDVTNEGWQKAMTFYSELYSSGVAPKGVPAEQSRALFESGKCAFFLGVPAIPTFEEAKGLKYGFAPHPYFEGGEPATPSDSFALGINPYTKNQEAALAFVSFATLDPEGNLAAVADNPNPTPNKEASPRFWAQTEEGHPQLEGIGDLVGYELENTVVHRPPSTGYIEFETIIGRAFSDIRNGKDVAATLDAAQSELESELAR